MPSNSDPDQRTRGGFAILGGILVVAVLILNLQAVTDLTRDRLDLIIILPEAAAVTTGTPVWVEGVESGRVRTVEFVPTGDSVVVAVAVRLEGRTRAVLRRDSDAHALRDRFIGQPLVSLTAGTAAARPVAAGDTLRARPFVDPMDLLDRARGLPAQLTAVLEGARRVGALAEARQPELEVLARRVDAAMEAAAILSADMENGSLGPLLAEDGLAMQISALQARMAEVSGAVGTAMERYGGAGDAETELGVALESLSTRAAGLAADLDELGARMEAGGGVLSRMEQDSALAVAIRGVQAQMDSVRSEATSIMLRMLVP